jgi:hypothetical protein
MSVYGTFQAIKQIHATPHGTIWTARSAGTSEAPDCCIKLIDLHAPGMPESATAMAEHLLYAAAIQREMGNKSPHWAPVYHLGSQGSDACYVTRLYPRSAQTIIEQKIKLTSTELKTLLLDVIDGLLDLQAALRRSHGNLKPTNILIADRGRIRRGAIFLSGPDAGDADVPSLTRTPDSKAIGELIYALVTSKPHVTARWPLAKSAHWKRMGPTGKPWFSLCDDLLNTVDRRGLPTLERIRERVDAISAGGARIPRTVVALVLIAALGTGAYVKRDELPGWYAIARGKSIAWIANGKTQWNSWTGSSPPSQPIAIRSATKPATQNLVSVSPPVAPINPIVPVAPLAPPPPPQPVQPRVDPLAMRIVESAVPPEFHSDAATKEFRLRKQQFVSTNAAFGANAVLHDWTNIKAQAELLESRYPPLDLASTEGWPTGLAGVMNTRRDAALVQAIDAIFDRQRIVSDPFADCEARVNKTASAAVAAREAMARGDVLAAQKSIAEYRDTLKTFPASDDDLKQLFAPVDREFTAMADIQSGTDRTVLARIADDESAALATRVAAWFRLGTASANPWPTDFTTLVADDARATRLITLLHETGGTVSIDQITSAENNRRDAFFSRLKDQSSVIAALSNANDDKSAALLAKSPNWFRYNAALYLLKNTAAGKVTDAQKKQYTDLASQVNAPNVQVVHDVLEDAQNTLPPSLAESGPASVKGWQLRPGWTKDHCTYVSPAGTDTLEFIHVHVPGEADGVECYLCTTEVPIALLRHLINGNLSAFNTAETLNASRVPLKSGMRNWKFDDTTGSINLDESDYSKCFVVSPNEQLPLSFVTPQLSFYLARRLGCRLPTSHEWLAALAQARASTDANMKGFASIGFRLRDRQFAHLLTNPNRDRDYWPDDNIFIADTLSQIVPRQAAAAIWQAPDLDRLSHRDADSPPATQWPLSTLASSSGYGFRTVGDSDNFAGVFHDLIGNVAEYTMDTPVMLAEKVSVASTQTSGETVHRITDWFSEDHLKAVSVIGGSALSPPNMDPEKPYPLPASGPSVFADVGFRLAFTDPASVSSAQRAVIGEAPYLTAP